MPPVLTDLCLKTIVEYFPRYNLAFNTTKSDDMKRRFEFLRKLFSLFITLLFVIVVLFSCDLFLIMDQCFELYSQFLS